MPVLLLFDFDGVIADSLDVFQECLATVFRKHGLTPLETNDFLRLFDGNMVVGLGQLGLSAETIALLLEDLKAPLAAAMDRFPPFPGIPEVFRKLTAAVPVYVVTSNLTGVVATFLEHHGIGGIQDVIGSDKEPSKQVKIRRLAAQWPDHQPVYVGDTLGDMREAREAGARPVGVAWGWHDQPRLHLGNPSRIVQSPGELAELIG
jgi:phosphoglycolate phosphatase